MHAGHVKINVNEHVVPIAEVIAAKVKQNLKMKLNGINFCKGSHTYVEWLRKLNLIER